MIKEDLEIGSTHDSTFNKFVYIFQLPVGPIVGIKYLDYIEQRIQFQLLNGETDSNVANILLASLTCNNSSLYFCYQAEVSSYI